MSVHVRNVCSTRCSARSTSNDLYAKGLTIAIKQAIQQQQQQQAETNAQHEFMTSTLTSLVFGFHYSVRFVVFSFLLRYVRAQTTNENERGKSSPDADPAGQATQCNCSYHQHVVYHVYYKYIYICMRV